MEVLDLWEVPVSTPDLAKAAGVSVPKMASALKVLVEREILYRYEKNEKSYYQPMANRKECLIQRYLCTGRVDLPEDDLVEVEREDECV